jgi:hypothetical protein
MKRFHFYHAETGAIHQNAIAINVPPDMIDACVRANCPPGHLPIEGEFDALSQRVNPETKQAEDWRPPPPSPDHEWHSESRRWTLSAAAQERQAARANVLARIAALEAQQHRPLREATLGIPGALERLREIDAQIAAQRTTFL